MVEFLGDPADSSSMKFFSRREAAPTVTTGGSLLTPAELRKLDARWMAHNMVFEQNDNNGPSDGAPWIIERRSPATVLSAPHAVNHWRPGRGLKSNDANTGGLALALAEHLGASVVALRRGGKNAGDPNFQVDHPMKVEAAALVADGAMFVDLHGMSDDHGYDLLLGLGADPGDKASAVAERIVDGAAQAGIRARIADRETGFSASGAGTMTMWACGRGAAAVQIEIARRVRSVKASADVRRGLLSALVGALAN